MATVTVVEITEGWPQQINGFPELTNIDLQVDATWVRVGYHTSDLTSASVVQDKLTADSDILLSSEKQKDSQADLGATPVGVDRADLIPDPFDI